MAKNYIKVTPKGEKKSFILQASLENHYRSLGATIEEPTEEEIAAAFPESHTEKEEATNATADAEAIAELQAALAAKEAEVEALKEERDALKAALKEAEALAAKAAEDKKTSK